MFLRSDMLDVHFVSPAPEDASRARPAPTLLTEESRGRGARSMARQRSSMALLGLVGSVVCSALLAGACNDSQKPPESTKPAPQVTAVASPAPPPAALQFTDVTAAAGVVFRHEAGATGKKWYPETMGAGGGFFDYDGDGWLDILLVNGRQWPRERQEPEPTMCLYLNQGD